VRRSFWIYTSHVGSIPSCPTELNQYLVLSVEFPVFCEELSAQLFLVSHQKLCRYPNSTENKASRSLSKAKLCRSYPLCGYDPAILTQGLMERPLSLVSLHSSRFVSFFATQPDGARIFGRGRLYEIEGLCSAARSIPKCAFPVWMRQPCVVRT